MAAGKDQAPRRSLVDSRTENRHRQAPAPRVPPPVPANQREWTLPRAGWAGSPAFPHLWHASKSRCCRGRFAAPSPRSNRPSQRYRTSSVVMVMAAGADTAHVMMMSGLRQASVVLVTDDLSAVFAKLAVHRRLATL